MTQVVQARPMTESAPNPAETDQAQEHVMEVLMDDPRADARDEETRRAAAWVQTIPHLDVVVECGDRGAVDRHLAGLPELGVAQGQERLTPVDVLLVEPERLPDAHAGR